MSDSPNVTLTFVAKPWWTRFLRAAELAIFGSVIFEGEISDLKENEDVVE